MQIKITVRYHLAPAITAIIRKREIINVPEDVEKWEPLSTVGGKVNWCRVEFNHIKSCLTLCNPVDCSTPGLPVPHHLPEFAQVHVYWIGKLVQPLWKTVGRFLKKLKYDFYYIIFKSSLHPLHASHSIIHNSQIMETTKLFCGYLYFKQSLSKL